MALPEMPPRREWQALLDHALKEDVGPGDVTIQGARTPILRRVAPAGLTDCAGFDADGDGDHELVVWRTDVAGHGALTTYHFAQGPRLARTIGPAFGIVAPGARVVLLTTAEQERVIVSVYPNGKLVARRFDADGSVGPLPSTALSLPDLALPEAGGRPLGQGVSLPPGTRVHADLDGDRHPEQLSR